MDVKKEIIKSLRGQKPELSRIIYSCLKQDSGYQFWLYIDLADPDLKVKKSSMLTMSTIPNPANWYPETDDVIIYVINSNALDYLSLEAEEYYDESPEEYLDDWMDEFIEQVEMYLEENYLKYKALE